MSFKNISLPSVSIPIGSLIKFIRTDPAKAYATTKGGEAR
jgi:hypothetical protein